LHTLDKSRRVLTEAVFRLQEFTKGHRTHAARREMEVAQWMPGDVLQKLQQRRLRALLTHAARTVPYYASLFRNLGGDFKAARLTDLPFLTKEIVRQNLDQMKSRQARGVRKFSTGGSTGAPMIFYLGPTRISSDIAARLRAESWFGINIGDPEFAIWGSPVELTKQDRIRDLRDRLLRTRLLSAFEMSPATMTRYLDEISKLGCRRIFGYPSSIALLCDHARREGRDLRRLGVKAVFVTAEYLYENWRTIISETFNCPVANGYGGRDSGFVAHECPAGGMHISADRLIVEIVDDHGRMQPLGSLGEIVVTNMDTPEMPFIRYRTGDVGALASKPCACGRTLPLLERIEGRKTDFVIAPDGRVMHGLSLIYVIREIAGVGAFRITQKRLTDFEVEIVRNPNYDPGCESLIQQGFSRRLRAPVAVRVRYSDSIIPTASGKTRFVISEVQPPRGLTWQPSADQGNG
jgi:phenylacetate-CoA ligase